jgi:hypothetical protein
LNVGETSYTCERSCVDSAWFSFPVPQKPVKSLLYRDSRLTPDFVVELPTKASPNPRIWRLTLSQVPDLSFKVMEKAFHDEHNWVSLVPGFASERALSEYISALPHLLEDGLVPYPSESARELVFPDRTRLDVLLLDRMLWIAPVTACVVRADFRALPESSGVAVAEPMLVVSDVMTGAMMACASVCEQAERPEYFVLILNAWLSTNCSVSPRALVAFCASVGVASTVTTNFWPLPVTFAGVGDVDRVLL